MIKNDPWGTLVKLVKGVETKSAGTRGRVIRSLRKYTEDKPGDKFEVEFDDGATYTVRRDEIEPA